MSGFFSTEYLDMHGRLVKADFFRADMTEVRQEIEGLGGQPIRIRYQKHAWWKKEPVGLDYKVRFLRALSFHIKNGRSPGKALELIINSESNSAIRIELNPSLEVLRRGGSFSQALEYLNFYNRTVVSILRGGEAVGEVGNAVDAAVRYLQSKKDSSKQIMAAVGLLGVDVSVALSSVFTLQFVALPWLEKNGLKEAKPERMAEFQAALANAYVASGTMMWITVAVCTALAVILLVGIFGNAKQRLIADKALLRIPVLKSLFVHNGVADTFGIVAVMVSGKVALNSAIKTAIGATIVPSVIEYWEIVMRRVLNGMMPASALQGGLLMRAEELAVSSHQNTEQLAAVLLEISKEREILAKESTEKLIGATIWVAIVYTVAVFAVALYVLSVQSTGAEGMLENMAGGF